MYEPQVTVITATSNIVDSGNSDDFMVQVSLLDKQTYPYVEHLVIDNASRDGTVELLKDYKNNGYISFFSEPDRGKFDAYNKGIMRAKGKYVSFISCDDFYQDVTAIEGIVNLMEENDADFCFFPTYCILPDGPAFLFAPNMLNAFQVVPCPRQAFFFRRSSLEEIGYFDEKFKLLADYDLVIRLMLAEFKGVYYDRIVLTYKQGAEVVKHQTQGNAECNHIFYKNYRTMYNMTNEVLDRMVMLSEFPMPLLEKLSLKFPEEDRALFFERADMMYDMRLDAQKSLREQQRNNRG